MDNNKIRTSYRRSWLLSYNDKNELEEVYQKIQKRLQKEKWTINEKLPKNS